MTIKQLINTKILEQNIKVNKAPIVDIMECVDIFPDHIDSDFKNWKLNKSNETQETQIAVLEIVKDSTTKEIFTEINNDLSKCVLSVSQIVEIVKNNSDILNHDGKSTMFLTQDEQGNFFRVHVWFGAFVRVYRLESGYIWRASYRNRFVVPQHALCNSDVLRNIINNIIKK